MTDEEKFVAKCMCSICIHRFRKDDGCKEGCVFYFEEQKEGVK